MDYDRAGVAETYRRARALPPATLALWRGVLRELVAPAGVARIVDVGCGTGRFTGCLVDAFPPLIIGLDPSIGMLAVAERSAAVRYTAGVAEALPLARPGFDLAFMSLMWHHVVDPRAAVAELARVLRPGGSVFLRTPTVEILDAYPFMRFFPESRALDERRHRPRVRRHSPADG